MSDNSLLFQPISSVLDLFKTKTISPFEYLDTLLTHIDRMNPTVNSLTDQYADEARMAARASESRYMSGEGVRPLDGIPFSVKDSIPVRNKRCTSGSYTKIDLICDESDPCVDRLVEAGAILHSRTASPEFSWAWTCDSKLNGTALNPWNHDVTCGGSCGGAAASLASGLTPLSLGADSAGSIRMPSAMCGVVGYKPPFGRNPVGIMSCEEDYNVVGPLARTVDDCRLMQNVLNGTDPRDPFTIFPQLILDVPPLSVKGLRIAYSLDMGFFRISQEVRENTTAVLRFLESQGAIVEPVDMTWAQDAYDKADANGDFIAQDIFKNALVKCPDMLSDYTYYFADLSIKTTLSDYVESYKSMYRAWPKFSEILNRYDCFICPTVATTEVPVTFRPWDKLVIEGEPVSRFVFTQLFNVFRFCPVLAVPSGKGQNQVPTGIQVVGSPFDDAMVFNVGQVVETEFGFFNTGNRNFAP
ncbi:amidase [bacterium]|nr:amidase [bacterium]